MSTELLSGKILFSIIFVIFIGSSIGLIYTSINSHEGCIDVNESNCTYNLYNCQEQPWRECNFEMMINNKSYCPFVCNINCPVQGSKCDIQKYWAPNCELIACMNQVNVGLQIAFGFIAAFTGLVSLICGFCLFSQYGYECEEKRGIQTSSRLEYINL